MNEFVIMQNTPLTPQQLILGITGTSAERLIEAIRENRDGRFDGLYQNLTPAPAMTVVK